MELIGYTESTALWQPGADGKVSVPLAYNQPTDDWRSARRAWCVTPTPLDLQAGDLIDVRLTGEISNSDYSYQGAWTAGGAQSEHWGLWVMMSSRVTMSATQGNPSGTIVEQQNEENVDDWIHHHAIDRAMYYVVKANAAAQYFAADSYFVCSKIYVAPGDTPTMTIEKPPYPKLAVAQFR